MRLLPWIFVSFLGLWVIGIIAFLAFSRNLPSVENFETRQIQQSTKIYDRTGTVLLYDLSGAQHRTMVPNSNFPQSLKDAVVSIEDENFYSEPGFSWTGMIRALIANITHGHIVQGASTITQQLARNAFLTPDQTLSRKIKELILAIELNRTYSKDQILYFYMNEVPFGPNLYGAETASEAYFDKHVQDLNTAESAILAASLQAPSYYSPWGTHTKDLIERQHLVLRKMLDLKKITPSQYQQALQYKLSFQPQNNQNIKAPHFVMAVQDYLIKKYGEDIVQKGGLRVITTLDWDLQQAAEKAVADGIVENQNTFHARNASLVAEDPKTGQILSMVGSKNYFDISNDGNFNVATQGIRQPGSSLKPFVYMTAFEKGYTPDTVLFDVPTEFAPACPALPDYENTNPACFHPHNYLDKYRGPISMRYALGNSVNIPAVKTLYLAGLNNTLNTLHSFGITTLNDPSQVGLSVVLGGGGIKMIDEVGAYSVLAQDGIRHQQTMVLEVRDTQGNVLESYTDQAERVVDPQYPRLVNDILSDSNARMDLFGSQIGQTQFPDFDVAIKTGTSNDYRDAWAFGYTPSLVAGVWVGNNDNTPMERASGARTATPIWHEFMAAALQKYQPETFTRPEPVAPAKAILGGNYIQNGQVHTILYYVNKDNPTGPAPANPTADPQYTNWETGVQSWVSAHMPNLALTGSFFGQQSSQNTNMAPPQIQFQSPQAGDTVNGTIALRAELNSGTQITSIKIYYNSQLVQELNGDFGTNYPLQYSFAPGSHEAQNLLELEVLNKDGASSRNGIVLY